MDEKKRILILTCSHGSGHKMVAQTLKDTFDPSKCEVFVRDLFNEISPTVNHLIEKCYLLSYTIGKDFYKKLYYGAEKSTTQDSLYKLWTLTQNTLMRMVEEIHPDCIVNTYMYTITAILNDKGYLDLPIYTVVTDFCIPAAWIHPATTKYYVACDNVVNTLVADGIPQSRIKRTGIPIRPSFYKHCDRRATAEKYGLNPHKHTLLICAGTHGVLKDLKRITTTLSRDEDLQTVVICGRNKKLFQELKALNHENIVVLGFVSDIHELYRFSDIMVTKPGGITLSEVVVTQLPTILYQPTPGQEGENAQWFQHKNAAVIANTPTELIVAIQNLKGNEVKQYAMKHALKEMYYGRAAQCIADDIYTDLTSNHCQNQFLDTPKVIPKEA